MMSNFSESVDVEHMSDQEQKLANKVIEILDQWSDRYEGHQTEKREDARRRFRGPITVRVRTDNTNGSKDAGCDFQAKARNLSTRGLSFIHPEKLEAKNIIICLDRESKDALCMNAEIVRARQVHNGFWEYGATFSGRAN